LAAAELVLRLGHNGQCHAGLEETIGDGYEWYRLVEIQHSSRHGCDLAGSGLSGLENEIGFDHHAVGGLASSP